MNKLTRIGLVSVASIALVAGVTPMASAKIVIGGGMSGVALGMTKAEVVSQLGQPNSVKRGTNATNGGKFRVLYFNKKLQVTMTGGSVSNIRTEVMGQKTSNGVGVGSSRKQVKNNVPKVKCSFGVCRVGNDQAGTVQTDFILNKDKNVSAVNIGVLFD